MGTAACRGTGFYYAPGASSTHPATLRTGTSTGVRCRLHNVANNYVVTHRATGKTRNIIMVALDPKASFCACLYPYRGGLPCRHLIRLAHSLQIVPSTLAAYHQTTAAYKEAYSHGLIAIETPEEGWAMDDLLPPPMKVMPGRPRVRRFTNNMDAPGAAPRAKRKCKRCKQPGHMAKTCNGIPVNSDP